MAEPLATGAAVAVVTAVSAVTLALFGVDYYSMLYSFVGALLGLLSIRETISRGRAVLYVALNTVLGAALGNALVEVAGSSSRAALIGACIVCGAGAQMLVTRLLTALGARIDTIGGKP